MEYVWVALAVLVLWTGCGVFACGSYYASFQRGFPMLAVRDRESDRRAAMLVGLGGPITVLVELGSGKHGWLWPWAKKGQVEMMGGALNGPAGSWNLGGLGHGGHRQAGTQVSGSDPTQGAGLGAGSTAAALTHYHTLLQAALAYQAGTRPSPTIENAGIRVGEIIAWRAWRVEHGWLYSVIQDHCEWAPGATVEAHTVSPVMGDGIHAFKTRKRAIEYSTAVAGVASGLCRIVVGRVALWGSPVYEFEEGWHAEFARVHSLDFIPVLTNSPYDSQQDQLLLKQLRETYGVEAPEAAE